MDWTSDYLYIESITKALHHVLKECVLWEIMKGREVNTILEIQGHAVLVLFFFKESLLFLIF